MVIEAEEEAGIEAEEEGTAEEEEAEGEEIAEDVVGAEAIRNRADVDLEWTRNGARLTRLGFVKREVVVYPREADLEDEVVFREEVPDVDFSAKKTKGS